MVDFCDFEITESDGVEYHYCYRCEETLVDERCNSRRIVRDCPVQGIVGFGDVIERAARFFYIRGCFSCQQRQRWLNTVKWLRFIFQWIWKISRRKETENEKSDMGGGCNECGRKIRKPASNNFK